MNKKKVLAMVTALALVAVVGIGATLAYFTDKADIQNVITMGHVDINLTENKVEKDADGEYVPVGETELTEEGLTFEDVVPGQTVPKNPTITVEEDSENCYVRATVTVESQDIDKDVLDLLTKKLTDQILSTAGSNWTYNGKDGYFYYGSELKAAEKAVLFETVTIPGEWDNAVADKSFSIKIAAEAVQSKYVDDVLVKDGEKVSGWNLTAEDIQEYEAKEEPKTE